MASPKRKWLPCIFYTHWAKFKVICFNSLHSFSRESPLSVSPSLSHSIPHPWPSCIWGPLSVHTLHHGTRRHQGHRVRWPSPWIPPVPLASISWKKGRSMGFYRSQKSLGRNRATHLICSVHRRTSIIKAATLFVINENLELNSLLSRCLCTDLHLWPSPSTLWSHQGDHAKEANSC